MKSGGSSLTLLLGRSRVRVHNRGEPESINRRRKLAWVEAEGGTSRDQAEVAAEGNGAGVAAREDPAREGPVGASTEGIARET
jgi:hypothetical protein